MLSEAKLDDGNYSSVEVYTHGEYVKELAGGYEPSPYVYGRVDVDYMETVCKLHGGICI